MKVKIIKTGKTEEVNDSYGARLVEQGKAVIDHTKQKAAKAEKSAEQPAAEGKPAKKSGKGD